MSQHAAYGFRVEGVDCGGALAVRGADAWPALRFEQRIVSDPGPPGAQLTESDASIQTPAAHLRLERATGRVLVSARQPVAVAELAHPCLWPAAAVFGRWRGFETLHAGAYLDTDGGAWAVCGDRGSGKSTLLAALAVAGHEVLADDLLVVGDGRCFAGPRCVDLRPEAVAALGLETLTTPVRCTERGRLALDPIAGEAELRGFVYLGWGERLELEPIAPAEHLGLLTEHRRVAVLGAELELLLDLAGLPAVRLRRPRSWAAVEPARRALAGVLARVWGLNGAGTFFRPQGEIARLDSIQLLCKPPSSRIWAAD